MKKAPTQKVLTIPCPEIQPIVDFGVTIENVDDQNDDNLYQNLQLVTNKRYL